MRLSRRERNHEMRGRPLGSGIKLEERRRKAVAEALSSDAPRAEVAKRHKVSVRALYGWLALHAKDKKKGLRSRPNTGAPKKVTAEQLSQLERMLLEGAKAAGYPNDLWTCARIRDLIKKKFKITYHVDHIGRLLAKMGWSPQCPEERAIERDDRRIKDWVKSEFPRIKKKPEN